MNHQSHPSKLKNNIYKKAKICFSVSLTCNIFCYKFNANFESIFFNLYRVAHNNQIEIILAYFMEMNSSNWEIKSKEVIKN